MIPPNMHLTTIARAALRMAAALLIASMAFAQSASTPAPTAGAGGQNSPRFDGKWLTKLACPAKGNTEGYTWQFAGVIQNNNFRGEHGTAGEPGYLLIEGKIAENGSAKLTANGIVASRKYARGVLAHKGEEYSYNIKAEFKDTEGTGTRDTGIGVIGRPCTFDFVKQ
jgi:hypothetical protein